MATSTMDEPKLPGGYLVTPRVPQGLAAAVEGLTREVLRHSPEDIYVFAAHHFEKLLHIREQCGGTERVSEQEGNVRALREMSKVLKMREVDRGNGKISRHGVNDQVGWSLNQTARVLKRHRSIFGDAGRRISTDEVFRMAKQKDSRGRSGKLSSEKSERRPDRSSTERTSDESSKNVWKASTSRTDRSEDSGDTIDGNSEPRSGPKIITQIPALQSSTGISAKDIKTELRKNRISSRERRSVRAKPEARGTIERSVKSNSSKNSSDRRTKAAEIEMEKRGSSNGSLDSIRSSKDRQRSTNSQKIDSKSEDRAIGMERVKDYVLQRFATTKSLEELQSVNYVEKVQGIIDETGPIIKGKVDELKSGMIGRSKRSSWFASSNANERGSNDSQMNIENQSDLKSRLTETQCLLENVSSSLTRPHRRSRSARSSRRSKSSAMIHDDLSNSTISDPSNRPSGLEARLSKTRNLLEDISSTLSKPMRRSFSAKTLRRYDDGTSDDSGDISNARLDETRKLLEGLSAPFVLQTHRLGSAKGSRANLNNDESSHSDSQSAPNVSLPAVRSVSVKSSSGSISRSPSDNLVLPAISPEAPKSAKIKEDLVLPILSPPGTASTIEDSKISGTKTTDVFEENEIPEIPVEDYIPEAPVEDVFRDSLNVTPNFDGIPQRPDSLEPEEPQEIASEIEEKFQENLETSDNLDEVKASDIKNKLQELEEAERRIDRILDTERHEDKNSLKSEEEIIPIIDEPTEENSNVPNDAEESNDKELEGDRLPANSPESNSTYILTEGSPYDIPDTVTTVIIPERVIETPESSPVEIQTKDDSQEESSLHEKSSKSIEEIEAKIESPVHIEDCQEVTKIDEPSENAEDSNEQQNLSPKIQSELFGELVEPDITESVSPIMTINYVHGIDNIHDIQISHQDLDRINEEMSEELEDLGERDDVSKETKKVDTIEEISEESLKEIPEGKVNDLKEIISEENLKEIPEEKGNDVKEKIGEEILEEIPEEKVNDVKEIKSEENLKEIPEPKGDDVKEKISVETLGEESKEKTESDLSPMPSRPELDSESSNEAKESSAADEPLEATNKCGVSLEDEEEASSETRTPESSNEVKETTLTDGLSLSLDPTRPYVPELNLDSLQDMTVSSFKMTEDEYENQCKVESEATNSITDTLTSDENNRINNGEFVEEQASSSERSKLNENAQEEIVEEQVSSERSRLNENAQEEIVEEQVSSERSRLNENAQVEIVEEQVSSERSRLNKNAEEEIVEEQVSSSERSRLNENAQEEIVEEQDSSERSRLNENAQEEIVEEQVSSSERSRLNENAQEEVVEEPILESRIEVKEDLCKKVEAYVMGTDDEDDKTVQNDETNVRSSSEEEKVERQIIKETENSLGDTNDVPKLKESSEDQSKCEKKEDLQISSEQQSIETHQDKSSEEIKKDEESPKSNLTENKTSFEDNDEKKSEISPSEIHMHAESIDMHSNSKSEDDLKLESLEVEEKKEEIGSVEASIDNTEEKTTNEAEEGGNDESFVEEETPLAVSRSASQCTTRRVSSGNLARLREDFNTGNEIALENDDEKDQNSKVKFSKIAGETISEQGSENEGSLAKDNNEFHIYVPDVDASKDYSTTDSSSTVESAVTKIQARVRGFLTRRRLHRGQQNRSSTLGSIPSIQDSIAIEPVEKQDDSNGLVDAATKIQANYRRYKARNRLRREDAVHRTTLSLEKSFADSGLQHTGEFHDCIPLPIHDLAFRKSSSNVSTDVPLGSEKITPSDTISLNEDEISSTNNEQTIENDLNKDSETNVGQMFFGQSTNVPIIQFDVSRKIGQLVDLVVLAKEEAALQSGYLNFITSVEDAEPVESSTIPIETSRFSEDQNNSNDDTKEPLALSDIPIGVVIEEVTSSGAENFMKSDDPDLATESIASLSSSRIDNQIEGEEKSKDCFIRNSESDEKIEKNLLPKSTDDSIQSENLSFMDEKGLLGPESSVDSMEIPQARKEENFSKSSEEHEKEEKLDKSDTEASSALSFSMKAQDFLGSEETTKSRAGKTILEVTLTPSDLMKSKSQSQESQLGGERIESPITMVQMTPGRSDSFQREEDDEINEKNCEISVESNKSAT